jgi:hypothetical protein
MSCDEFRVWEHEDPQEAGAMVETMGNAGFFDSGCEFRSREGPAGAESVRRGARAKSLGSSALTKAESIPWEQVKADLGM